MWREGAPQVLATLARRYADFDAAEDAVQEALVAAALQWPTAGLPDNPVAWLTTVATRRMVDGIRSDSARRAREEAVAMGPVAAGPGGDLDDSLLLLLMCCHPLLTRTSQVALTLRAVGGLTTAQIARGFLVPEPTMAQRISRAKARLREGGVRLGPPAEADLPERMRSVLHVLHLVFTEGHTASEGAQLVDVSLTREAIRLTRRLRRAAPYDDEAAGLLALMLLTDARREARVTDGGDLVPIAQQDRGRWDRVAIAEGVGLLEEVLPRGHVGPFQLQAAIAAVHAEAPTWEETDWRQVVALYDMLATIAPGAPVTLNRAVAVAMVDGPDVALALVEPLLEDPQLRRSHRTHAVRAHLLEQAGRDDEARAAFRTAATLTASLPEQRYLNAKAEA